MIVLIICARRKPELSREEFEDYWKNKHSPLVQSVPEFMKYVRKYVHFYLADGADSEPAMLGDVSDYDAVGQLWFDDHESMAAAYAEPEYLRLIKPDEEKFIDRDGCLSFVANEKIIMDDIGHSE
jgi:uncharacterized protein (TIGR02118 family)